MEWVTIVLQLLKSLTEAERAATKAGFAGPLTAYYAAKDAGKSDRAAYAMGAAAYARCCDQCPELGVAAELK